MPSHALVREKSLRALPSLVSSAYAAAVSGGHVIFSETELAVVRTGAGVPFQLRLCPALAKKSGRRVNDLSGEKERSNSERNGRKDSKPDPFEDPPSAMTVAHLPPDHLLLLNKYPVIPRHFLLVTRQFKEQSGDLDIGDLAAMYGCLEAWERRRGGEEEEEEEEEAHGEVAKEEDGTDLSEKRRGASRASRASMAIGDENGNGNGHGSKEPRTGSTSDRRQLYAFYNCGESSGASQPHRHIQFLPVEDMMRDQKTVDSWDLLLNGIASDDASSCEKNTAKENRHNSLLLPISHYTTAIPPNPSPETLHNLYLSLLRRARSHDPQPAHPISKTQSQSESHNPISSSSPSSSSAAAAAAAVGGKVSYNFGCTTRIMALCPRRQSRSILRHDTNAEQIGTVELNGCLLAGTAMVKTREEWMFLREEEGRLDGVLRDIGFPSVKGEGVDGVRSESGSEGGRLNSCVIGSAKETKI